MMKKKGHTMINFRADTATVEAIKRLADAQAAEPGELMGGSRSKAIRVAILEAAARLDQGGEK